MSDNSANGLWDRMVREFTSAGPAFPARQEFFQPGVDRVALVKHALRSPGGNNRALAVNLIQQLAVEEQMQLFPELVQLARAAHGPVGVVRDVLLTLPREWVLARIDQEVDPILEQGEYDDYWMFLELYERLDPARALHLARRVAAHPDPDVRELAWKE